MDKIKGEYKLMLRITFFLFKTIWRTFVLSVWLFFANNCHGFRSQGESPVMDYLDSHVSATLVNLMMVSMATNPFTHLLFQENVDFNT